MRKSLFDRWNTSIVIYSIKKGFLLEQITFINKCIKVLVTQSNKVNVENFPCDLKRNFVVIMLSC